MQENTNIIRIGTSPMTPAQLLMQLWPKIQARCPDIKFQVVPFANTPTSRITAFFANKAPQTAMPYVSSVSLMMSFVPVIFCESYLLQTPSFVTVVL